MSYVSNLLSNKSSSNTFYLVQGSSAQSALPILRGLINSRTKCTIILACSLYAPSTLLVQLDETAKSKDIDVKIVDWTNDIPGYGSSPIDWKARLDEIQNAIKGVSQDLLSAA